MNPRLRSLLARVSLIGGVALVATLVAQSAPHDQTILVALGSREVTHIEGVVTKHGDTEPSLGFSQDFPGRSPRTVRHTFSAPNGTYTVVISLKDRSPTADAPLSYNDGGVNPLSSETSFERQVSLVGGEVTVSPD